MKGHYFYSTPGTVPGALGAKFDPIDGDAVNEPTQVNRILLAIGARGNHDKIKNVLKNRYDIIEMEQVNGDFIDYDLLITDALGFSRWKEKVLDDKQRMEPTLLPIMMILSKSELSQRLRHYWDLVDEFVVTPIDSLEFIERIAMLLRARYMSLVQKNQLAYLITHDRVTGLPNAYRFSERLSEVILDASVLDQPVHMVVLRLNVTRIMHSLGHRGLDRAAALCSKRIKSLVDSDVFISRLTTDTWGLVFPMGKDVKKLWSVCRDLQGVDQNTLDIEGEKIHVTTRIGVASYPNDAQDAARLLDCAVNAVSEARDATPRFYSSDVQHRALRHIRTETRLRQAIEENQFELWFQPQVRLVDRRVTGVEALVRWRLPNGSLAPPGDFLDVAESTGLVVPLDRWVIQEACRVMREWRAAGLGIERIAVNVNSQDVQQLDFADFIREKLDSFELPPPTLEIELTESTLFEASDINLGKLNDLRGQGMDIAIDDFGTGYSSLSYLHKLPINILKIDQCFIKSILESKSDVAITSTIVWLAKNFQLSTIAEGIETENQSDFVQSLGVDIAQGYHFARPMPETDFRQWLREWH